MTARVSPGPRGQPADELSHPLRTARGVIAQYVAECGVPVSNAVAVVSGTARRPLACEDDFHVIACEPRHEKRAHWKCAQSARLPAKSNWEGLRSTRGDTTTSRCSVRGAVPPAAYGSSLPLLRRSRPKTSVMVRRPLRWRCRRAQWNRARQKNTPSGTSLMRWRLTAARRRSRRLAALAAKL
jgi:hypothetical protein